METTMTLGRRIAQLRKEKELKQDDLAQMLDVSAQAVSKWENDQTCPDISLLPRLASDMQAIVVIGDINVDQIENKIKTIFSDIPAPEVPTQKIEYKIPANEEPIFGIITDAEATSSQIEMLWRGEPLPKALNNTDVAYMMDLVKAYIRIIMRERFSDITSKPDAPFISASFGIGKLCSTCEAVSGNVAFKDGEALKAFHAYLTEIEKLRRFGFTEGEVLRAKENILQAYDRAVEAAATRKNAEFVRPILNNFFHNEPITPFFMPLMMTK